MRITVPALLVVVLLLVIVCAWLTLLVLWPHAAAGVLLAAVWLSR